MYYNLYCTKKNIVEFSLIYFFLKGSVISRHAHSRSREREWVE